MIRYIEHVPEFVEAVTDIARQAGIQASIEPVIKVACEFFLSPPELMAEWLEEKTQFAGANGRKLTWPTA